MLFKTAKYFSYGIKILKPPMEQYHAEAFLIFLHYKFSKYKLKKQEEIKNTPYLEKVQKNSK